MSKRTKLTREQLLKLKPCVSGIRWYDAQGTTDLATLVQAAYDQKKYAYIIWLAVWLMSRKERIRFACDCASDVAHLNTDPRVMAAIEAAERCIEHDTASNRAAAADAAARAASYAAYGVDPTRAAARAATEAAYTAVYNVADDFSYHAANEAAAYAARAASYAARADSRAAYAVKAMRALGIEVDDGQ